MPTLEEITEKLRRAAAAAGDLDLGKTIKLDLAGDGVIHIDGAAVTNEDKPADLVVSVSRSDLVALGRRELDPVSAMMRRRLRVSDMALAMSLQAKIQTLFARAA